MEPYIIDASKADLDINKTAEIFNEFGFLILRQGFHPDIVKKIKKLSFDYVESKKLWVYKYKNKKVHVKEFGSVIPLVPALDNIIKNALPVKIIREIVKEELYYFRDAVIVKMKNEDGRFPMHQDSANWNCKPERLVSIWIPLRDVNEEMGVLHVVPKSHKIGGSQRLEHQLYFMGIKLPSFVHKIARAAPKNSNSKSERGLPLKMRISEFLARMVAYAGIKVFSFISERSDSVSRGYEEFRQAYTVDNEEDYWNHAIFKNMNRGDCIIYHSRTLHGSKGNRTEKPREAFVPTFMGANFTRNGIKISEPNMGFLKV